MPFITQGKTNVKYIFIITVVAIFAGGIMVGAVQMMDCPGWWPSVVQVSITENETAELHSADLDIESWQAHENDIEAKSEAKEQIEAQEWPEINFFYSETCSYCKTEKAFLENLEKIYPGIKVNKYVASFNRDLLQEFFEKYQVSKEKQAYVPATFIAEEYFIGFNQEIGQKIEAYFE